MTIANGTKIVVTSNDSGIPGLPFHLLEIGSIAEITAFEGSGMSPFGEVDMYAVISEDGAKQTLAADLHFDTLEVENNRTFKPGDKARIVKNDANFFPLDAEVTVQDVGFELPDGMYVYHVIGTDVDGDTLVQLVEAHEIEII